MINEQTKQQLIDYVLTRVPVWLFNTALKGFSTQTLYRRFKLDLIQDFSTIMPGELDYAIVMAEAFSGYEVKQIRCGQLRYQIDQLKHEIKILKKCNPGAYAQKVDLHNALVEEYSQLLKPQQELIARYKKTQNIK
jgi:hypothetical protein